MDPRDRGAAHNVCNMNLRIKPKQEFYSGRFPQSLRIRCSSFDQEMSKIEGEKIKCIPNSPNFLQASLDSLVKMNSVKLEVHLKTRTNRKQRRLRQK